MRIICISGHSGAGKTTLIERLTAHPRFAERRLGVVKHTHHRLDWHPPEKDSTRFWQSNAVAVAVVDPVQTACFTETEQGRDQHAPAADAPDGVRSGAGLLAACRLLKDRVDLVFAEGFSGTPAPKLWLTRDPPAPEREEPPAGTRLILTRGEDLEAWSAAFPDLESLDVNDIDRIADRASDLAADIRQLTPP